MGQLNWKDQFLWNFVAFDTLYRPDRNTSLPAFKWKAAALNVNSCHWHFFMTSQFVWCCFTSPCLHKENWGRPLIWLCTRKMFPKEVTIWLNIIRSTIQKLLRFQLRIWLYSGPYLFVRIFIASHAFRVSACLCWDVPSLSSLVFGRRFPSYLLFRSWRFSNVEILQKDKERKKKKNMPTRKDLKLK